MVHALFLASISGSIVNEISNFIREAGWPAIFFLMVLNTACIPVPSEAVMLFAGFAAADPAQAHAHVHLSLAVAIAAGAIGNVIGALIAYAVGWFGRIELLERHGRWLHIKPGQIQRAQGWFERYGGRFVFFGRLTPTVHSFVSLPAGVARMSIPRFLAITIAASLIWVSAFAFAGHALGSEWATIRKYFDYVDYVVLALIVLAVIYLIGRRVFGAERRAAAVEE